MQVDISAQVSLMNQKVDILVREFNEALGEMQVTTEGLAKVMGTSLKVLSMQIKELQSILREVGTKAGVEVKYVEDRADKPSVTTGG